MARDLLDNGGNGRKVELDVKRRVDIEGVELDEYMRSNEGEKTSTIKLIKRDVEEASSDSDDDIEMNVITGLLDIVVRPQGRQATTGFFKSSKNQYVMFPFHEEKCEMMVNLYNWMTTNRPMSSLTRQCITMKMKKIAKSRLRMLTS